MNRDKHGSESASAEMSAKPPTPKKQTEPDLFATEIQRARQAMSHTLRDMGQSLKNGVDPRNHAEHYPWTTLAAAAAAGFLLASAVTPKRQESLRERLRSLFPEQIEEQPAPASPKKAPKRSMLASLTDTLKSAVIASISAAVQANAHQPASTGDPAHTTETVSREPMETENE